MLQEIKGALLEFTGAGAQPLLRGRRGKDVGGNGVEKERLAETRIKDAKTLRGDRGRSLSFCLLTLEDAEISGFEEEMRVAEIMEIWANWGGNCYFTLYYR